KTFKLRAVSPRKSTWQVIETMYYARMIDYNGRKSRARGFRLSNNPVESEESQREKENDVRVDLIVICII
ncbi:Hypothetical predicted protein, partial [Paramuricea clavata]